jgi:hypothetical protein
MSSLLKARGSRLDLAVLTNKDARKSPLAVPPTLSNLDYWGALDNFKKADCNTDGWLMEPEFSRFIQTFFIREFRDINLKELFAFVNRDHSGHISAAQLLAWIYSVPSYAEREAKFLRQQARHMKAAGDAEGGPLSPKSPTSPYSIGTSPKTPKTPKTPEPPKRDPSCCSLLSLADVSTTSSAGSDASTRPASRSLLSRTGSSVAINAKPPPKVKPMNAKLFADMPMVVEFTFGSDFNIEEGAVDRMGKLRRCLKNSQIGRCIDIKEFVDPNPLAKSCTKAVVKLGSGIELWNQETMVAFRDDPFKRSTTIEVWAAEMVKVHLPLLLRVASL